jgi:predicted enzyme related to lactoylglutathione lyase
MLGDNEVIPTVAVRDLAAAKKFYSDTLGLTALPSDEKEVLNFKGGHSELLVYRSQFAGTNKATAVTWNVDDVEGVARTLKDKGVAFEHYDMPGMTLKGDVHVAGNMKAAWFKDPDGNIHALVSESR